VRSAERELDEAKRQNARLTALLDRLFEVAETDPGAARPAADLKPALDDALSLLDEALTEAERQRRRADELEALLSRALDGVETLEAEHTALLAQLTERDRALENVIALSERSLAAAASQQEALRSLGFWGRLFGRSTS